MSYSFTYNAYGNNTRVEITGNGLTMASSAVYTNSGNTLASVTDALGNTTYYGYDADTGVLNWVQYPEDSETLRTSYTYDAMYRATEVTSQLSSDTALTVTYGYTDDLLTSVTTGSTEYTFDHGIFDLRTAVKIGSRTLASYSYTDDRNFDLAQLTYGNGDSVSYTYDSLGRLVKETYEDGDTVSYAYDNNGALATVTDSATGRTTTYYYDSTDRLMRVVESGNGYSHAVGYAYDNINNLTGLTETIDGESRTTGYTYDDDNRIVGMTVSGSARTYTYDSLGRLSQRVSGLSDGSVLTETFTYTAPSAAAASGQVATMRLQGAGLDVTYSYTYDDNGNILTVSDGTHTTHYTYDKANQLIREDNQGGGFTHVWSYDTAGNILSRTEYAYTTGELGTPTNTVNYTYGDTDWGDLLTAYDGTAISYDGIGNPLSDGTWSYTWEHGRELAAMTDGSTTWSFAYDVNGLRTSRTNGSTTYNYIYNGGSLSKMTVGNNTLYFTYGAEGHPLTLTCNGTTYFYATNLQGDVVAILNASGTPVVRYTYDAWGNILTVTDNSNISLATLNPLRYRGYVYDPETGLYYLQSRYYDPEIGRFISVDSVFDYDAGLQGYDLFVYCGNNPVIRIDISGTDSDLIDVEDLDDELEPRLEGASGNGTPSTPGAGGGYGPTSDIKASGVPAGNAAAGGSGGVGGGSNQVVPQYARDVLEKITANNGDPPPGYKGGKAYQNDGRNGTTVLPTKEPCREYDVHPFNPAVGRGKERIVIDRSGNAWYTPNHYFSFYKMR